MTTSIVSLSPTRLQLLRWSNPALSQGQCRRHLSRPIWHLSLKCDHTIGSNIKTSAAKMTPSAMLVRSVWDLRNFNQLPLGHGIKTSCLWWLHWQLWWFCICDLSYPLHDFAKFYRRTRILTDKNSWSSCQNVDHPGMIKRIRLLKNKTTKIPQFKSLMA